MTGRRPINPDHDRSGCFGPTCHRNAHGTPRLKAGRYGVFGTSAALSSCGNRQLPRSRPVYRVSVAETSCPAVDLAVQEALSSEAMITAEAVYSPNKKARQCLAFGCFWSAYHGEEW
jgi:hypothetical protein